MGFVLYFTKIFSRPETYFPDLEGKEICFSDLGNILAYYRDNTSFVMIIILNVLTKYCLQDWVCCKSLILATTNVCHRHLAMFIFLWFGV